MKKKHKIIIIVSIVLFLLILIIASINITSDNSDNNTEIENHLETDNPVFEGEITNIRTDEIELTVTDGKNTGFTQGEPLILMIENLDTKLYSELSVGDNIFVEFDGIVMNSYPGRIGSIFNISVIDDY